jgi:hypothetical protein
MNYLNSHEKGCMSKIMADRDFEKRIRAMVEKEMANHDMHLNDRIKKIISMEINKMKQEHEKEKKSIAQLSEMENTIVNGYYVGLGSGIIASLFIYIVL